HAEVRAAVGGDLVGSRRQGYEAVASLVIRYRRPAGTGAFAGERDLGAPDAPALLVLYHAGERRRVLRGGPARAESECDENQQREPRLHAFHHFLRTSRSLPAGAPAAHSAAFDASQKTNCALPNLRYP